MDDTELEPEPVADALLEPGGQLAQLPRYEWPTFASHRVARCSSEMQLCRG